MSSELDELYQEVILDHSRRPRNFGELPEASVVVHGDNPSCGDEIHLAVKFDNGNLQDIKFSGQGCAISQASASLMTTKLKGKPRDTAEQMLREFHDVVAGEDDVQPSKALGDLRVMSGVRKFPQRVKCAMLAWRALDQALQQSEGEAKISTEADEPASV